MSEQPKAEEKKAPETFAPQTSTKIDLTELAKQKINEYVSSGKIVLEQKIDQKIVDEIAKAIKCSSATIYLARNKLLEERAKQVTSASDVKVNVNPQPKPPIPIGQTVQGTTTSSVKLVPLSEKLNLEKIFKNIAGILEGFGLEVPDDDDFANLGELWKPALSGMQIRVHERIVEGDTILYIAAGATASAFIAPILAQFMTRKKKPTTPPATPPKAEEKKETK